MKERRSKGASEVHNISSRVSGSPLTLLEVHVKFSHLSEVSGAREYAILEHPVRPARIGAVIKRMQEAIRWFDDSGG